MSKRLRGPLDTRYWPRVLRGGDVPSHAPELGQCWLWVGQLTDKGYATFKFKDKMVSGHRVSWELHCGPIPEGMCVLHRCDNPPCTNPAHLRLGTLLDNIRDRDQKGRQVSRKGDLNGMRLRPDRVLRGEQNGWSKLTDDKVREIRRRIAAGELRYVIAADLGLSFSQVGRVATGKVWAHIEGALPEPPKGRAPGQKNIKRRSDFGIKRPRRIE